MYIYMEIYSRFCCCSGQTRVERSSKRVSSVFVYYICTYEKTWKIKGKMASKQNGLQQQVLQQYAREVLM